ISVDKKNGVRKSPYKLPKSGQFMIECLDIAVRHRSCHRNTVRLSCENVGGTSKPRNMKCARRFQTSITAMHPTHAEVEHRPAPRRLQNAGGLRSRKSSQVNLVHKKCFDELSLRQWCNDLDDRLAGKNDRAFRHGI